MSLLEKFLVVFLRELLYKRIGTSIVVVSVIVTPLSLGLKEGGYLLICFKTYTYVIL